MSLTKASYFMTTGAPANVLDYGADPTGVADSTAAIQSAFDASNNVFFPAGTYLISGTGLEYQTAYQKISTITGAGADWVSLVYSGTGTLLRPNTRGGVNIKGIKFEKSGSKGSSVGINWGANEYSTLESCIVTGFAQGLNMSVGTGTDSFFNKIDSCFFTDCDYGIYMSVTTAGNLPSNSNTFINNKFSNMTNWGVYHDGGIKNTFIGCTFEGTGDGLYLRGNDCAVIGCYVEVSGGTGIEVVTGNGPGGNNQSGFYNAIINPTNAGGAGAFIDNGFKTFWVGRDGLKIVDLLLNDNIIANEDGTSEIILERAQTADNFYVTATTYGPIPDLGIGLIAGGYNNTSAKARTVSVGGVGDNNNRCGWTAYSIKTNGTGDGAEYYIRPVTWTGTAFAEQGSAGVYLQDNATSWSSASDERLKENLKPIENATTKLSEIRAVTGKYITDKADVSRSFLIAQDVQKVLPEAVNENHEGYLGLSYTDVIPLLVAAVKELTAKIEELQKPSEA